ncbi:MAG TPA: type II toxin-antitoxin system RelE/ParE family toxin [Steroidobacteraceae bacterium]|nr:type II toxin-antitoxin system RelE/ParE family toxin [Steroidobacteraceae bacterium]
MKPFQLSDPASAELADAIRWYEQQRAGLGGELLDAITEAVDPIRTHPEIGVPRRTRRPTRQLLVNRFPYNVVYRIRDDNIYVVAVAHTSRRPDYWEHRS